MLLDLARHYPDIIQQIEVERFNLVGASHELRATVWLHDGSNLFVKDYFFLDGTRQDSEGQLICRWDNAPHWKTVESYPHHRHVGRAGVVESSDVRMLEGALKSIRGRSQSE